ncbi:MAG: PEP-CTERM sorting domain-containing protein [Colwellia sp.]|nr:PEP-CTERM sorting domain-containing protein [Colwellia sp.]
MKIIKILILTASLLIAPLSQAGFITTQETALDAIFSQTSFGNMPIDIRIGTASELVFPSLLDITSSAEISQLFGMHVGLSTIVNFYFVDTISACGGSINPGIVGCGEYPGNDFVVESSFAAGGFGGELLAHELGHNLGLGHLNGSFLMNPFLNNFTEITNSEVSIIRNSPLVQTDGQLFWIDINPVLIVAAATIPTPVPEPSVLLLFLIAFGLMYQSQIKRNS